MLNLQSDNVQTNGLRLHYYRSGAEKPPLVLAHGISDDSLCWTPVAEILCENWDLVLADARGHGLSEAPEDGYTQANLSSDLAGLITSLHLEKPVILGHSMGARTALVMAGQFPDLPRAILLEDPPVFWRELPTGSGSSMEDWLWANKRKTHADLLAEVRSTNPRWQAAELEPWVNSKHRYSPRILQLSHPQDMQTLKPRELLKHIACPVIYISADPALGAIGGPQDVAELKKLIPQLREVHIPGAGHNIRRDQFVRYMEAVEQVLVAFQGESIC